MFLLYFIGNVFSGERVLVRGVILGGGLVMGYEDYSVDRVILVGRDNFYIEDYLVEKLFWLA